MSQDQIDGIVIALREDGAADQSITWRTVRRVDDEIDRYRNLRDAMEKAGQDPWGEANDQFRLAAEKCGEAVNALEQCSNLNLIAVTALANWAPGTFRKQADSATLLLREIEMMAKFAADKIAKRKPESMGQWQLRGRDNFLIVLQDIWHRATLKRGTVTNHPDYETGPSSPFLDFLLAATSGQPGFERIGSPSGLWSAFREARTRSG